MIPEHVLQKMRAALLVAGAAGCTRTGASSDAGPASSGSDGSAAGLQGITDATTDDATALDAGVTNDDAISDAAMDGAVVACPFHTEGHAKLADGGVQQARPDPGLSIIGIGGRMHDSCPGCGMGGMRPDPITPSVQQGDVQIVSVTGMDDAQASQLRRLLAGQRAGMRACYRAALNNDPTQEGKVTMTITFDGHGEVKNVAIQNTGGLQAAMLTCVSRRIKNLSAEPELAGATATARFTFAVQK